MYNKRYFILPGVFFTLAILGACGSGPKPKPQPDTPPTEQELQASHSTNTELSDLEKAQFKKAIASINEGKPEIAKKLLKQLRKSAPANSFVISNQASVAIQQEKYVEAQNLAQEALKLDLNNAQAHNILGLTLVESGDIKKAEQAYFKALSINSDYANAHFNIALVYDIFYQDLKRAIKHYQAYLALSNFRDKKTLEWVQELERSLENK